MKNKVYAVTVDFAGTTWAQAYERTSKLDAEVQILAKKSGAKDVFMHQLKTPVEGVPEVLVEAPQEFIDKVMRLPHFHGVREVDTTQTPTIRRINAPQIEPPEAMSPRPPKGP